LYGEKKAQGHVSFHICQWQQKVIILFRNEIMCHQNATRVPPCK